MFGPTIFELQTLVPLREDAYCRENNEDSHEDDNFGEEGSLDRDNELQLDDGLEKAPGGPMRRYVFFHISACFSLISLHTIHVTLRFDLSEDDEAQALAALT